jgi:uncharacterized RDD family membrane protein YckC
MDAQIPQTESAKALDLQYDVTGIRIVAALVDIVIVGVLFGLMALVFGDTGKTTEDGSASFHVNLTGGPFLLFLLAQFAYFLLFEGLLGATLGKLVMGLRVVKIDGSPCAWPGALVRNVLRLVDGLPFFYLVGLVAVAVTEKNQRLGDLAAKTLVVRAR